MLLDMADCFDRKRFDLNYCILFGSDESEFARALREKNLKVACFSGQNTFDVPRIFAQLVKFLRREKFDIVHTHLLQATIIGQIAARLARNSKQILTRHYTDDALTNSFYVLQLERRAMKLADKLTAVSKAVRDDIVKAGVEPQRIELIYNGVDLNKFDEKTRQAENVELPFKKGDYILGNVGNFWRRKGQEDLIRALPKILTRFPQTRIVFVGEETEETDLKRLAAELGISDKIFFAGFCDNVAPFLAKCDLYVHPSRQEPFGIAILEAMAAGKCVVATAVGGVPEIVLPGKTGFLVSVKDSEKLAETIIKAISQKSIVETMAIAGRRRVEEVFSLDAIVNQYENLYTKLARKN